MEFWTDMSLGKHALERAPDMVIRNEEEYIHGGGADFIFWAEGGDFEAFEAGLEDDPTVTDPKQMTETDTQRLYRVTATAEAIENTTMPVWSDLDIVLLEAEGTHEGWTVRMRLPDRETLDRYRETHRERGLPFQLRAIYEEAVGNDVPESGLTDAQREALLAAYEAGYFDVPRTTPQSDVAEALDISTQSLSERLRRATAALVEATLAEATEDTKGP